MNKQKINEQFRSSWITNSIEEDCMQLCEELATDMVAANVSSSFLRNFFGELRRIEAGGFESHRADFVLLRPKLAYTSARAMDRNDKTNAIKAFQELYKLSAANVKDSHGFKNLVSIMEAIIAFHKANGGSNK